VITLLRGIFDQAFLKSLLKRLVITPQIGVFDQTFFEKVCAQAFFEEACNIEVGFPVYIKGPKVN
jgi:hypothetical protein